MRKPIAAAATVVVLALLGILFWKADRVRTSREAAFPDGTRLEFLGSAVGSAVFSVERPWERVARRILPSRWQGLLRPVQSGSCSMGTNSVTFYFRLHAPPNGGPYPWQRYAGRDAEGFLYPAEGGSCSFGNNTERIVGLGLRAFPRRNPSFQFEFLTSNGQVLASLDLPNPVSGPFADWAPQSMPQACTNGPVLLTLEGLTLHTNRNSWWMEPDWRLETADAQWQQARTGYLVVHDATGNSGAYSSLQEPAWRVSSHVHRQRWEDFSAEETLVVTNLTIPPPGHFVLLNHPARLPGAEILLHAISSAGTFTITNDPARGVSYGWTDEPGSGSSSSTREGNVLIESWSQTLPFLLLEVKGMPDLAELRARAMDAGGHLLPLSLNSYSYRSTGGSRLYYPTLEAFTNGPLARLELVVSRALRFEFVVDPAAVRVEQ